MGSYRSKGFKIDIDTLPEQEPEPDYEIKTRGPKPDKWQLNILRGRREDELRGLAYSYARYKNIFYPKRRKCKKPSLDFIECEKKNGQIWTAFECQQENQMMLQCFQRECDVEMDKLRRNMTINQEWWWRVLYDENGEVGEQAEWVDEYWLITRFRPYMNQVAALFM